MSSSCLLCGSHNVSTVTIIVHHNVIVEIKSVDQNRSRSSNALSCFYVVVFIHQDMSTHKRKVAKYKDGPNELNISCMMTVVVVQTHVSIVLH